MTKKISTADRDILRRLGQQIAEIAKLPIQREKAELWRRLNDLEKVRPMVWINEMPWHELNVNDELTARTTDPWSRNLEYSFLATLYQWRHFPGDMIISDTLSSPLAIHSTGMGVSQVVDVVKTDETSDVVSSHFHPQISTIEDIDKIKMPVVTHDQAASEANYQTLCEIFEGVLPVRKQGIKMIWYTPWDNLIRLWGVQEAMTDMIDRPELINAAVSRYAKACNHELDQYEALNLLSLGSDNTRIGSGGYGYTKELPGKDCNPNPVRPQHMWGCSNAQIFSEISPDMHWEFALQHDMEWLKRWGMTYYGCCEPLDGKMGILRKIPNLRKISMSPWIHIDRAVREVQGDYVFSYKPNPAFLAEDRWRPELVRQTLKEVLDRTRGCHVEIILKDISTVRYEPQRLWEWEKIAMELALSY